MINMMVELAIAVRAWAVPEKKPSKKARSSAGKRTPRRWQGWKDPGPSDWSITWDTETLTTIGQRFRIGSFQIRRKGRLRRAGFFYDPLVLSAVEVRTLSEFADEHHFEVWTLTTWIEDVFLLIAYTRRGLVIGQNLPFDFARIASDHYACGAGGERNDKKMRGGFTFMLSTDPKLPKIQVKASGARSAFIRFTIPDGRSAEQRNRERGGSAAQHRGYFVDTVTLAAALLSKKLSLKRMAELLQTEHQKEESDEHGAGLTPTYLAYAMNDVQVTWECFEKLRERYESYHLSATPVFRIKSEASIGKAIWREMNLQPWRKLQPKFPDSIIAVILETYFGGRTECRYRLDPVSGVYVDFNAQYPTSFVLQDLWPFVRAKGISARKESPQRVQRLLNRISVDDVLDRTFWPILNALVLLQPDGDLLPSRAEYGKGFRKKRNVAMNVGLELRLGGPTEWYTLADAVASKLETGKAPRVLEVLRFRAGEPQDGLKPIEIAGDPRYGVDPYVDDPIKRLVELRASVKADMRRAERADPELATRLDAIQGGMKTGSSAMAYGIPIEMNVVEHARSVKVRVHLPDGTSYMVPVHHRRAGHLVPSTDRDTRCRRRPTPPRRGDATSEGRRGELCLLRH